MKSIWRKVNVTHHFTWYENHLPQKLIQIVGSWLYKSIPTLFACHTALQLIQNRFHMSCSKGKEGSPDLVTKTCWKHKLMFYFLLYYMYRFWFHSFKGVMHITELRDCFAVHRIRSKMIKLCNFPWQKCFSKNPPYLYIPKNILTLVTYSLWNKSCLIFHQKCDYST